MGNDGKMLVCVSVRYGLQQCVGDQMHAKYGFSSQCIILFGTEKSGLADQIEIKSDVQMLNMKYLFYIKFEKRKFNKFQNIIINL